MKEHYIQKIMLRREPDAGSYLYGLPVIRSLVRQKELALQKPVTFLVGENGAGKSTLLEAVAVASGFNPEGGSRNFHFSTYASHSELYECIKLEKGPYRAKDGFFLRAESFYNVASYIEELDSIASGAPLLKNSYGGRSLHEQSHGESFLSLITNRFGGNGLYLLDEPEAALSPARQFALLAQIDRLVRRNSQLIIATHSPILLAYPQADIFVLTQDAIELTPYEQTDHYILTRQFLNNPKKMLRYLLEDDNEPY